MLTSCSPGWIKFVETYYPDFIENLSTCKSPQQMMGAVVKSYFAEREKLRSASIFSVSIMPCTAKKFEAARPEMGRNGVADIDAVLTTRELADIIRMRGLDLAVELAPEAADTPFGERTTAGKLFGGTGGVMEAALRTAHWMVTGRETDRLHGRRRPRPGRGQGGRAQRSTALSSAWRSCQRAGQRRPAAGRDPRRTQAVPLHRSDDLSGRLRRPAAASRWTPGPNGSPPGMQSLYTIDGTRSGAHFARRNESVNRLYAEFLGQPLGEKQPPPIAYPLRVAAGSPERREVELSSRDHRSRSYARPRSVERVGASRNGRRGHAVYHNPERALPHVLHMRARVSGQGNPHRRTGQAEVIGERCIACGNCVRVCSQHAKQPVSQYDRGGPGAARFGPAGGRLPGPQLSGRVRGDGLPEPRRYAAEAGLPLGPGGERSGPTSCRASTAACWPRTTATATSPRPVRRSSATSSATYPDLIDSLAPIVSPMIATARVARHRYGDGDRRRVRRAVYRQEGRGRKRVPQGRRRRRAHVPRTAALMLAEAEGHYDPEHAVPSDFDPPHGAESGLFPISRGMLQAAEIREDLMTGEVVATQGRAHVMEAIKEFADGDLGAQAAGAAVLRGMRHGDGHPELEIAPVRTPAPVMRRYVRRRMEHLDKDRCGRRRGGLERSEPLPGVCRQ